jgi:FKBP-type peptidyl-prolyl cis-trans isomerase FkpA
MTHVNAPHAARWTSSVRRMAVGAAMLLTATACKQGDRPVAQSTAGTAAGANPDPAQNTYATPLGVALSAFTKTPSGLYYRDVKEGTGAVAAPGQTVRVEYTGYLPNGNRFDTSVGAAPIEFPLGQGAVIRGWDEGIAGMKVGGQRKLVIPAELGYGSVGSPPDIPPNSVLVFDVELKP